MVLRLVVVVVVALILARVALLVLRGRRRVSHTSSDALSGIRGRDLKTLRSLCRGDVEKMERLIEYEKGRRPGLSNQEACLRVIASYGRDNR